MPGQGDKLARLFDDGAALRSDSADGDAATAAEFHKSFVPESAQPAEHRIGVHAKYGRQIPRWRQPLPGNRLTVGDRPPDRGRNLLVQRNRARVVDADGAASATHTGIISGPARVRNSPGAGLPRIAAAVRGDRLGEPDPHRPEQPRRALQHHQARVRHGQEPADRDVEVRAQPRVVAQHRD